MKRSKTNRRVNKSSDHGKCYCYACDIEKGLQYIKKKFERDLISKQTNIEPEIQEIIEKRFWDMV